MRKEVDELEHFWAERLYGDSVSWELEMPLMPAVQAQPAFRHWRTDRHLRQTDQKKPYYCALAEFSVEG